MGMSPLHHDMPQSTDTSCQNPSYIGAIVAAVIQVAALLSYIAAYFPGGVQTLKFGAQMIMRGAGSVLPI